jgi:hypothetical protein
MSIKTATTIAIVGVAIGLVLALAGPVIPALLAGDYSTRERFAVVLGFYRLAQNVATEGGLLVFLVVLGSKQKGQS